MRKAKSKYFCDRIQTCSQSGDSKSGWAWINTLLGRKRKNANINELIINDKVRRLQKLNITKATGMDGVPAKILKIISSLIAPSLTFIFNLSIRTGIYIDEWKLARVIPIYKSDDKRKCENYRPISILPIVSKIFEGEVFSQMYSVLNAQSCSTVKIPIRVPSKTWNLGCSYTNV